MQSYKKYMFPGFGGILLLLFCPLNAQVSLSGIVQDGNGAPLMGATIIIKDTRLASVCDMAGTYTITGVPNDAKIMEVRSLGFGTKLIPLKLRGKTELQMNIVLEEVEEQLEEVVVQGNSMADIKKEDPVKVEVVETQKFKMESASAIDLVNRSPGIKIRQSGGLGSNVLINLNGFQGDAVRVFKDGIPMDYLDGAYGLGYVPTNTLERVEVYKGVLPADLGQMRLEGQ